MLKTNSNIKLNWKDFSIVCKFIQTSFLVFFGCVEVFVCSSQIQTKIVRTLLTQHENGIKIITKR